MIDFEALIPKARELTAGLSQDQLVRRPSPNTWCLAECVAHVAATNRLYLPGLTDAIAKAPASSGPQTIPWLERKFAAYLEPPYKMKTKAPAMFQPPAGVNPEVAIADWEESHRQLQTLSKQSESLDLTAVRLPSPAAPILKVTALGAFGILAAHSRRHLWQASRIRVILTAAPLY